MKRKIRLLPTFFLTILLLTIFACPAMAVSSEESFEAGWGVWSSAGVAVRSELKARTGSWGIYNGHGDGAGPASDYIIGAYDFSDSTSYCSISWYMMALAPATQWYPQYQVKDANGTVIQAWTNMTLQATNNTWTYLSVDLTSICLGDDVEIELISMVESASVWYWGLFAVDDINVGYDTGSATTSTDQIADFLILMVIVFVPALSLGGALSSNEETKALAGYGLIAGLVMGIAIGVTVGLLDTWFVIFSGMGVLLLILAGMRR